ncbi:Sterol desaturase [Labilithrix luteola]|uniref:Sterol desaturase n=1 Tax=Labilithrix luteola TaxID=1391654 RepID=A0A0K1QCE4_9BACT|nr:sterol desaturase family protein [Labilithrix luteola]AKV03398.1 Sterol desaturase [Labilithrix luteola]
MHYDPIALAVPLFFVAIAVELAVAKKRGVVVYRFADALTNLSCGITQQVMLLAYAALQLAVYAWVYEHARFLSWDTPWIGWALAFLGVDFLYYWWHRLSHEVNVLWAAHVVHHQSEDYNLAVALRQAVLTSWTELPFYLPLALLGVPTIAFATMHALSTLYQFWIHTQLVGKVRGPFDRVLNLPSHHRVHHAINARYLDKNYGATLIVWDRLFGTYEEETETPVYGITHPLASFSPMWAQVHYWVELARMTKQARRPVDKVRLWFASPAFVPEGVEPAPIEASHPKYDREVSRPLAIYVGAQYALVLVTTFSLLMWHRAIPTIPLVLLSVAVLGALVAVGGFFERRKWATAVEGGRWLVAAAALALWARG